MIELKNVSYRYKKALTNTLDDISAQFGRGKLHTIIGKSQSGKSTLVSLLSGLESPSHGTIVVDDHDLGEHDGDTYRNSTIGILYQTPRLIPQMTGLDHIILSLELNNRDIPHKRQAAYSILEYVGIDGATAKRSVSKLSIDEKQCVALARILSYNPEIIVADEPIDALSDATSQRIITILESCAHNDDKTVVVLSHSRVVSQYTDALWRLNAGSLTFIR